MRKITVENCIQLRKDFLHWSRTQSKENKEKSKQLDKLMIETFKEVVLTDPEDQERLKNVFVQVCKLIGKDFRNYVNEKPIKNSQKDKKKSVPTRTR